MLIFLLIFYLPYALMHAYFFAKTRAALGFGRAEAVLLALFLALMVVSPILVRMLERAGHIALPRVLSWVAFPWIAIIFWFVVLMVLVDVWNMVARAAALPVVSAHASFVSIAVIVATLLVWGLVEASTLRVCTVTITTSRLPPGSKEIRLVQISDVHLGIYRGQRLLQRILTKVRQLNPDVLVSTGDLVDSSFHAIRGLADQFREFNPPLGKFAVLGNHEFYAGLGNALAFHEAAGFRLLRGESVMIGPGLRLAGVDDPAGSYTHQPCFSDEAPLFPKASDRPATILLKHEPTVRPESIGQFDLQLSGHTHGGQVFPFHVAVRLMFPYGPGLHDLGNGSQLFLSRGAGTWGPPLRFLAPPDICLVIIRPAGGAGKVP